MAGSPGEVDGLVEPGFEGVREAFTANFDAGHEVGAALCVHVDGRKVVDLWGGSFDLEGTRDYGPDALQLVFSSTKGATATCANLLAQRGLLDMDAPVATYWPEFAQAGKADVPVRCLLTHQAGVPAIDRTLHRGGSVGVGPGGRRAGGTDAVLGARDGARLPTR